MVLECVFLIKDWREGASSLEKKSSQLKKLIDLSDQINESKLNSEFVMHNGI